MIPILLPLRNSDPAWLDPEDVARVLAFSQTWFRRPGGGVCTSKRGPDGPRRVSLVSLIVRTDSRVVYLDGNSLNCTKANLRVGKRPKPVRERKGRERDPAPNQHGYPGVVRRRSGTFTSRCTIHGRAFYSGVWPTALAAYLAYKSMKEANV